MTVEKQELRGEATLVFTRFGASAANTSSKVRKQSGATIKYDITIKFLPVINVTLDDGVVSHFMDSRESQAISYR
ncbi:hypothetical protein Tco_1515333 [Tanacetum coccineum]